MQQFGAIISQNQRLLLYGIGLTILCYYLLMDGILYSTLQSMDLVNQKLTKVTSWSPFHPLSVKLIMTDPSTHYILTPLSEHFNSDTNFSKTFYFITPNMITFTHLIVSFIAAKFVFSASLQNRRIGVLIYQFRSFLDAFDGTIYRSHASYTGYKSDHSRFGFWFDSVSDIIGGFALLCSVLFFLWWKCPPEMMIPMTSLPWKPDDTCDSKVDLITEKPINRSHLGFGKQFIFWRCFCVGLQTGVASAIWDQLTMQFEKVFMVKLEDPDLVVSFRTLLGQKNSMVFT